MDNKTTVENAYEYNARGDLTPFLDMVDPDVHWNEAENTPYSQDGPLVGLDAVQTGVVDRLATDFTEFHANVSRVIGAGTTVVRPRTYVGSTSAGGALDAIVAHVYDFEKDKAVRFPQCSATRQWHRVLKVDASDSSNPSLQSVDHPR